MSSEDMIPEVCIAKFMVKYFPKSELPKINHRIAGIAKRAKIKHIKYFRISNYPITLTKDNEFPTEATKERILRSIWKYSSMKGKFEDFEVSIEDIEIKDRSNVSYKFRHDKD